LPPVPVLIATSRAGGLSIRAPAVPGLQPCGYYCRAGRYKPLPPGLRFFGTPPPIDGRVPCEYVVVREEFALPGTG